MFASYIEMKLRPGQMDAMKAHTESIKGQIQDLGMEQFLVLDKGDDSCTVVVVYKTAAEQEANGPKAAEILGGYAEFVAAPPGKKASRSNIQLLIVHTHNERQCQSKLA